MLCEDMGRVALLRADGLQLLRPGHRQHGDPGRVRHARSRRSAGSSRCSNDHMRSCFSMTEPETAGSDPTGLAARAELDGGEWVINGHKWFTSGYNGAVVAIAMVVTDPDAAPHKRASMILVPIDTPGFTGVRPVPVMGHDGGPGHWEVLYEDVRVPEDNLLGPRGEGFTIAQARLGPGRIHHCMRAIGSAERAFELMCRARAPARGLRRHAGREAVRPGLRGQVADGDRRGPADGAARRLEDGHRGQARRPPGHLHDQGGGRADAPGRAATARCRCTARWACPTTRRWPALWRQGRWLRIADGPDEVHKMVIAMRELNTLQAARAGRGLTWRPPPHRRPPA